MSTNIVIARFDEGAISSVTAKQWQYSYGQILRFVGLELPYTYEVHMSNEDFFGVSKTQMGNANGVLIPKEYYWSGGDTIYAWIYLHAGEDDGETVYKITIPLRRRAKPSEEQPTPEEKSFIEQVIVALNNGVERAESCADDAQASAESAGASARNASESAEQAQEASRSASKSAQSASTSASNASTSASNASQSATDAHQSKVDAETAQNKAEEAQEKAEQAAAQAGYMFFYIDENGDLIYQRTPNVNVDFYLSDGDLYVRAIA